MANTSKSKLQISTGGKPSKKFGASTSSDKNPSPLQGLAKKSYKKQSAEATDFGAVPDFGNTGMTGES